MKKISDQQAEIEELELRWFELTEEIGLTEEYPSPDAVGR